MSLSPLTDEEIFGVNIFAELGLNSLPEERRVAMLGKLSDIIQQRVMLHLVEKLSDDDAQTLEKLMREKGETSSEVVSFVQEKIPDMPDMLRKEIVAVKRELIERTSTIENQ